MTDATQMDEIAAEINAMKIDLAKLKIRAIMNENDVLRHKLKFNAQRRKALKREIDDLRKQAVIELPF